MRSWSRAGDSVTAGCRGLPLIADRASFVRAGLLRRGFGLSRAALWLWLGSTGGGAVNVDRVLAGGRHATTACSSLRAGPPGQARHARGSECWLRRGLWCWHQLCDLWFACVERSRPETLVQRHQLARDPGAIIMCALMVGILVAGCGSSSSAPSSTSGPPVSLKAGQPCTNAKAELYSRPT